MVDSGRRVGALRGSGGLGGQGGGGIGGGTPGVVLAGVFIRVSGKSMVVSGGEGAGVVLTRSGLWGGRLDGGSSPSES